DDTLAWEPGVAVGGKNSFRHDADGLLSGQAGLQFLSIADTYGNVCPMECEEEVDGLHRPGLRKTGHRQIVTMLIPAHDAVDVGAVAAPAYLPGVADAWPLFQPAIKGIGGIPVQFGQALVPPIRVEKVLLLVRFLRSGIS